VAVVKRILLVVWGFEAFGGMEQHVLQLACGLQRAGVDVTVLSEMPVTRSNFYGRSLREAGVRLLGAPHLAWIANGLQIALHPSKAAKDRLIHGGGLLSRRLRRTLDQLAHNGGVDLIHVHGCRLGQAWVIDWVAGKGMPSVYTEHVAIADLGGPLTAEGPETALAASILACVSEHSRESLESILPRPRSIAITGHIIDLPPPDVFTKKDRGRFEVLCAARLEHYKGVDVLLRALAILLQRRPDAHLTVAGDGSEAANLKQLAEDLGVQGSVTFAGALSPDRMAEALGQADAVVLPSRSEGLPLSVVEALAAGKPLVATRAGGIPEIIGDGENGLLADADDPAGLAEALSVLAENPELRARLAAAGRRTFEESRHHEGRVIPEMLALYREAARAC
jgi:glycosyltransferase involved in cell wall biosynthesis